MSYPTIATWRQGAFIDGPNYRGMPQSWKEERDREERHLVRPSPTGNAICHCPDPALAAWIAERLNLAAKLERELARRDAKALDRMIATLRADH